MSETATKAPVPFAARFIERLGTLSKGDMAVLKRSAGLTVAEARPAFMAFYRIYPEGKKDWDEEIYFLVATLYGLNPHTNKGDFGSTMRLLRGNVLSEESADRRMSILLNSSFDDIDNFRPGGGALAYRLRQCVKLTASHQVGVNWLQLLKDLCQWTHPHKIAQKRWAKSYFGTKHTEG